MQKQSKFINYFKYIYEELGRSMYEPANVFMVNFLFRVFCNYVIHDYAICRYFFEKLVMRV